MSASWFLLLQRHNAIILTMEATPTIPTTTNVPATFPGELQKEFDEPVEVGADDSVEYVDV